VCPDHIDAVQSSLGTSARRRVLAARARRPGGRPAAQAGAADELGRVG